MAVYGDTIVVKDYKATNTGIVCELDGEPFNPNSSIFEATQQITFTGVTRMNGIDPNIPVHIKFIAPKLIFQSEIAVNKNGYNSLTLSSNELNLDSATWRSASNYPGPVFLEENTNLQLTSSSNGKTLFNVDTLTGSIGLIFDDSVAVEGNVVFYVNYTVANNLVIKDGVNYTVTKLSSPNIDTYTVRRKAEITEIKSLTIDGVLHPLKDETARAGLTGKQDTIDSTHKLGSDLVDDTDQTNKFVTAEDKTKWNAKQDEIEDLEAIRDNAEAGKTASTTISGYGDVVSHNASDFATAAQGAKADSALQSATYDKTTENIRFS